MTLNTEVDLLQNDFKLRPLTFDLLCQFQILWLEHSYTRKITMCNILVDMSQSHDEDMFGITISGNYKYL